MSKRLGVELFVKRDDLTGGAETGNKIRKLEFLLADARAQGADTVITCGGLQSNHCRATALCAVRAGMKSVLCLRTRDVAAPPPLEGNVFIDLLVGAEIRLITPEQYAERDSLMRKIADDLRGAGRRPYVIPEGGSNALGAMGYVEACHEIEAQLAPIGGGFDTIAYACGSGGTGAGLVVGARRTQVARRVVGFAVCDDRAYFQRTIAKIVAELGEPIDAGTIEIDDRYKGIGYALNRPEELCFVRDVAREEGLVLDPVYTGKALFGLVSEIAKNKRAYGGRVLFVHTGGIFGLLAKASELGPLL